MGSLKAALERVIRRFAYWPVSHPESQSCYRKEQQLVPRFPTLLCLLRGDCDRFPHFSHVLSGGVEASHDLRERATRLWSEATAVSAESARNAQGSSSLEFNLLTFSMMLLDNFWLNNLLKDLSCWVAITDGLPGDALPGELMLEQLREMSYT